MLSTSARSEIAYQPDTSKAMLRAYVDGPITTPHGPHSVAASVRDLLPSLFDRDVVSHQQSARMIQHLR